MGTWLSICNRLMDLLAVYCIHRVHSSSNRRRGRILSAMDPLNVRFLAVLRFGSLMRALNTFLWVYGNAV